MKRDRKTADAKGNELTDRQLDTVMGSAFDLRFGDGAHGRPPRSGRLSPFAPRTFQQMTRKT